MYRMYSRQLRFLSLFLIFSLSARRAGILKHFSNLPLLSNTLIVKSQSTAIFCPRELVTIWHGSFISSTPLHHPDQVSMIHHDAPYPVYTAPKLSLRWSKFTFSSPVSTLSRSRSSKLLLHIACVTLQATRLTGQTPEMIFFVLLYWLNKPLKGIDSCVELYFKTYWTTDRPRLALKCTLYSLLQHPQDYLFVFFCPFSIFFILSKHCVWFPDQPFNSTKSF